MLYIVLRFKSPLKVIRFHMANQDPRKNQTFYGLCELVVLNKQRNCIIYLVNAKIPLNNINVVSIDVFYNF